MLINYLMASNSLKATELLGKIRQANGVVENSIGSIIIGIRTADDTNDRKVLTISTSYGVDDAEATNSERDNTSTDTSGPSIAIYTITSVHLIAAAYDVELRFGNEMIK